MGNFLLYATETDIEALDSEELAIEPEKEPEEVEEKRNQLAEVVHSLIFRK